VIDIVEPVPAAPAKAEALAYVETPAAAPEPAPKPITTEPVVVGDPSKPKKGGWWARAKAGLTGQ
jgi:ribonuclease E